MKTFWDETNVIAVTFTHLNCYNILDRPKHRAESWNSKTIALLSSNVVFMSDTKKTEVALEFFMQSDVCFELLYSISHSLPILNLMFVKVWNITAITHVQRCRDGLSTGGRNACGPRHCMIVHMCSLCRMSVCVCVYELSDLNSYGRTKRLAIPS